MSTPAEAVGQQMPATTVNEYLAQIFIIQQMLQKMQTGMVVEVKAVTNAGGITPSGTVDVLPLVNQMTGARVAVKHKILHNIPYNRIQGGANAIIIDPQVGDIGICLFASRDISAVKKARGQANPGSQRTYDYADGMYVGQILNGTPTQYVVMNTDGITVVSPNKITLQAPNVFVQGNLRVSGVTVGAGDGVFENISSSTHTHGGVESGGSNTNPPNT